MEINKRCISVFAKNGPFAALATKSKLLDPSFSLTSELILVNYLSGKIYPAVTTELKFCKILWCEFEDKQYLVAGHENGVFSVYDRTEEGLILLKSKQLMEDDVTALDFLAPKATVAVGSSKGKLMFVTLTNLEKEYDPEIPISIGISAMAWNPKVSKILCIGSMDGVIKVLDIKKKTVVMTLNNREFSEVRQLEWDPENNTKLNVMSERGYITTLDLSNDTFSKYGQHDNAIIGFYRDILISKSQMEVASIITGIKDSFECAISKRDPVIALSYTSGTTNIISIPVRKKTIPFCMVSRYIYTPTSKYEIRIVNNAEAPDVDPFYQEIIAMHQSEKPSEEIAEYILKNCGGTHQQQDASGISVDVSDPLSLDFIHGNLQNLKGSDIPMQLGTVECLFSKNIENLAQIHDFRIVYLFSRLLGDYSLLSNITDSRILAALIIFNKLPDFNLLNKSKEGRILKAILTKDYGMYIDNVIQSGISYLKQMKMLESLLDQLKTFNKQVLKSSKLINYFWYKIFIDGPKSVEDLNILDPNIEFYRKAQTSQALPGLMKNLSVRTGSAAELRSSQTIASTISSQRSFPTQSVQGVPSAKPYASPSPAPIPTAPRTPIGTAEPIQQPTSPIPMGFSVAGRYPAPTPPKSPLQMPISHPGLPQRAGISQPQNTPRSPIASPFTSSSISGYGELPQRKPMARPPQNLEFQSVPSATPSVASNSQTSQNLVENADYISKAFMELISEVRRKASANTALILKQRKQQCLNALSSFDSLDKSKLPSAILHAMDLISKRVAADGSNMKPDLDALVSEYSDVVWLKATVDLIKMIY